MVFIPFDKGKPTAPPTPFLSGFVPDPKGQEVYGRPVGVVVAPDGSLLVSDDGARLIWRVSTGALAELQPTAAVKKHRRPGISTKIAHA